jgi:hypothetical protein
MNLPHLREQFLREHEWTFTHDNKWMALKCIPKYNPVRFRISFFFYFRIIYFIIE